MEFNTIKKLSDKKNPELMWRLARAYFNQAEKESNEDKKNEYFKKGISCPHCYSLTDDQRKKRFAERQKQIQLAQERGEIHIGEEANPKRSE